jgi:hypothetical protein
MVVQILVENSEMLHSMKQSVRACGRADPHGLCNMASITCSKLSGVWTKSGRPCGLLSITDPSWHHFHTHQHIIEARSIMSFKRLLETMMCSCNRLCFDNSTAAVRCCTHQYSISTKLQTSLVSMGVACRSGISATPVFYCFYVQITCTSTTSNCN